MDDQPCILYNITAKRTTKFGTEKERLSTGQVSFVRCLLGITRLEHGQGTDKERIKYKT